MSTPYDYPEAVWEEAWCVECGRLTWWCWSGLAWTCDQCGHEEPF